MYLNSQFMAVLGVVGLSIVNVGCGGSHIAHEKIPSVVLNTLKAQYPITNHVVWEKDHDLYEADVRINDSTEVTICIDETGKLVMQKYDIPGAELPAPVVAAISAKYKEYAIEEAERLERAGRTYYQVELDHTRKKDLNLVFLPDGNEDRKMYFWD
ncbi:MAG: PepSY-like domain-containing protein [Chitinophagaceae bacterium]